MRTKDKKEVEQVRGNKKQRGRSRYSISRETRREAKKKRVKMSMIDYKRTKKNGKKGAHYDEHRTNTYTSIQTET